MGRQHDEIAEVARRLASEIECNQDSERQLWTTAPTWSRRVGKSHSIDRISYLISSIYRTSTSCANNARSRTARAVIAARVTDSRRYRTRLLRCVWKRSCRRRWSIDCRCLDQNRDSSSSRKTELTVTENYVVISKQSYHQTKEEEAYPVADFQFHQSAK
jgi:hypothetical protein